MGVASKATLVVWMAATALHSAQAPPRTTRDKVYAKEQAVRGAKQYAQICGTCHDPSKVPAGKKPAPALVGDKFLDKWQDRTLGDLSTIIQTTMPNDGSVVLTDAQTIDLVAYLLQANNFPDGPAALRSGASSQDIVIVK